MSRRILSILTVPVILLAIAALAALPTPLAHSAFSPPVSQVPSDTGQGPADPAVPDDAQKGYYIQVSLADQVTRIYLDGREVKSMVCSSGIPSKPTPTGRFYIQNRGEYFFSEKYQQGGRWWVSFKDWGIYLFHSVPTDRDGDYIPEEAEKLGQPASHGCIRLAPDDARWIYDNIPEGAPVDIG